MTAVSVCCRRSPAAGGSSSSTPRALTIPILPSGPRSEVTAVAIIALSRPGMAVQSGFNRMARTVILAGFLGNMNRDSVRVDNMVIHLNAAAAVTFPEGSEAALDFACESAIGIPMNDAGEARP